MRRIMEMSQNTAVQQSIKQKYGDKYLIFFKNYYLPWARWACSLTELTLQETLCHWSAVEEDNHVS